MAPSRPLLAGSGEIIQATYSLGYMDQTAIKFGAGLPVGECRDRHFDPAVDSNYTEPFVAPYELIRFGVIPGPGGEAKGLTFLCHKASNGDKIIEMDTIVMEVGARTKNGLTVAARSFGKD
jgi:hypothetical protein